MYLTVEEFLIALAQFDKNCRLYLRSSFSCDENYIYLEVAEYAELTVSDLEYYFQEMGVPSELIIKYGNFFVNHITLDPNEDIIQFIIMD